ncbi:MAG TPA: PKD domain-containing protein [Methanocella sp.]|nr:PKD domain-containing protein [Methanocella sp.]
MVAGVMFFVIPGVSLAATIHVGAGQTYQNITTAVNAAHAGDTIQVDAGEYHEAVTVDKPLTLTASNPINKPLITQWGSNPYGITVTASDVVLDGFSIVGNGQNGAIQVTGNHCTIKNVDTSTNYASLPSGATSYGIHIDNSVNNEISDCMAIGSTYNLYLSGVSYSTLTNLQAYNAQGNDLTLANCNNIAIKNGSYYKAKDSGVKTQGGNNIIISGTSVHNNHFGINLDGTTNSVVARNSVYNNPGDGVKYGDGIANGAGISLSNTNGISVYQNDFYNNSLFGNLNVCDLNSQNTSWSTTTQIPYTFNNKQFTNYTGNYWGSFHGNDSNSDGIGDQSYTNIAPDSSHQNATDHYPLIVMEIYPVWGNTIPTITPTATPTPTVTATPSVTPTPTTTSKPTVTPRVSPTQTVSPTSKVTVTPVVTATPIPGSIYMSVDPASSSISPGETKKVNIIASSLPMGISGYDLYLSLGNSSVATVTNVSLPSWAMLSNTSITTSKSGQSIRIVGVDLKEAVRPGAKNVVLATITVKGGSVGSTNLAFGNYRLDADDGSIIKPSLYNGLIEVGEPSPVEFTADIRSGSAPLTVNFTDATKGKPTSWSWDFNNDGVIDSTLQNPNHTYTTPGNYTVKLTVTIDGNKISNTKTDYIRVVSQKNVTVETFPGETKAPTDPNGDGLYEDINGNRRLDFNDVVEFFEHMNWVKDNKNVGVKPYDFNGNGKVDYDDVVVLYNLVMNG